MQIMKPPQSTVLGTLFYKNIIDAMRGVAEPEIDGREGLKSLELLAQSTNHKYMKKYHYPCEIIKLDKIMVVFLPMHSRTGKRKIFWLK